jgi:hypothetical protein
LPVVVPTRPALDSLASVRRTKLGLVFTLIASRPGQDVNRNRELCVDRHNCYYNSNKIKSCKNFFELIFTTRFSGQSLCKFD